MTNKPDVSVEVKLALDFLRQYRATLPQNIVKAGIGAAIATLENAALLANPAGREPVLSGPSDDAAFNAAVQYCEANGIEFDPGNLEQLVERILEANTPQPQPVAVQEAQKSAFEAGWIAAPAAPTEPDIIALAEKCSAEVGRHEGEVVWVKFHSRSAVEAFAAGIVMSAALKSHAQQAAPKAEQANGAPGADVLPIGSKARKIGGSYQADGTVVSVFKTTAGELRYVFEFDQPKGMLHIFGPSQVARDAQGEIK